MYLDSPFERCPVCDRYVLLDQTAEECAHENRCSVEHCPLQQFFSGHPFSDADESSSDVTSATKPA